MKYYSLVLGYLTTFADLPLVEAMLFDDSGWGLTSSILSEITELYKNNPRDHRSARSILALNHICKHYGLEPVSHCVNSESTGNGPNGVLPSTGELLVEHYILKKI